MRKIRKVTIRKVDNEWQVATTYGGLYNPITYCSTKKEAIEYAKERGWETVIEDKVEERQ